MAERKSRAPQRKVAVGAAVGGAVGAAAWITSLFGVDVPAEVAVGFATSVTFIVQYFVPNAEG